MSRTCADCGKPLKGRSSKRYCDSSCRARASLKRTRQAAGEAAPPPKPGVPGPVEKLTAEEVDETSPLGAAAVVLARRIDEAKTSGESGSALASMVRQLQATLVEARPAKPTQKDEIDELRERRDRRLGRAAG